MAQITETPQEQYRRYVTEFIQLYEKKKILDYRYIDKISDLLVEFEVADSAVDQEVLAEMLRTATPLNESYLVPGAHTNTIFAIAQHFDMLVTHRIPWDLDRIGRYISLFQARYSKMVLST